MAWWVWMAAGAVVGMAELALPGYIFLGFALGAEVVGIVLAMGVTLGLAGQIALWAVVSLAAWAGLRALLPHQRGQVKRWTRDINKN